VPQRRGRLQRQAYPKNIRTLIDSGCTDCLLHRLVILYFPIISCFENLENPLRLSLIDGPVSVSISGLIIQIQYTRRLIRLPCGPKRCPLPPDHVGQLHFSRSVILMGTLTDFWSPAASSPPVSLFAVRACVLPRFREPFQSRDILSFARQLRRLPLSHPQSVVLSGILEPESCFARAAIPSPDSALVG
jgi:hypothetical protein